MRSTAVALVALLGRLSGAHGQTMCADDPSFIDAAGNPCSHYQGWGCDDISTSGGTTSAQLKMNCPLSCGICSGEFRQTGDGINGNVAGCLWTAAWPFSECCSSGDFTNAAGADCADGTTQYNACCVERECADDPAFVDEGGYPCADWQDASLDCFADHGYSAGGKDALLANCGLSCASCDKWRGDGNCWSECATELLLPHTRR